MHILCYIIKAFVTAVARAYGGYGVMVAQRLVVPLARDRYPIATPEKLL